MKILNIPIHTSYLLLSFLIVTLWGCTPDDEGNNLYAAIQDGFTYEFIENTSGGVDFTNISTGGNSYHWDFGDGNTSTEVSPDHYYLQSGVYTVVLTVTNAYGQSETFSEDITIEILGFGFEVNNETGEVSFMQNTTGGESYEWDFGDGTSSNEENPTHTYSESGTYTVSLTVTYPNGEVVTYTQEVTVDLITCDSETAANAIDPESEPLYIGFKDGENPIEAFGDMQGEVVNNPLFNDDNPSCYVYKYVKTAGAQSWSGIAVAGGLTTSIAPASQPASISLKAMGATRTGVVKVRLEFEPYPNVDPAVEIEQELTQVGVWQELTFDFSAHTDKTFKSMVIYVDQGTNFDDAEFFLDEIKQIEGISSCLDESTANNIDPNAGLFIGFKDQENPMDAFGDMLGEVVENPNFGGVNNSCNVYKYVKTSTAQSWSGIAIAGGMPNAVNPATQSGIIKLKAMGATRTGNVTVRLEFEPYPNVDPAVEIVQPISAVGVWEELTFDFSSHTDKTFKSMVIYVDQGTNFDDAEFFLDDILQVP